MLLVQNKKKIRKKEIEYLFHKNICKRELKGQGKMHETHK